MFDRPKATVGGGANGRRRKSSTVCVDAGVVDVTGAYAAIKLTTPVPTRTLFN